MPSIDALSERIDVLALRAEQDREAVRTLKELVLADRRPLELEHRFCLRSYDSGYAHGRDVARRRAAFVLIFMAMIAGMCILAST